MSRFTFHVALAAAALTCSLTAQADVVLPLLSMVPASSGSGLTGNWFKVDDNAKISNVLYTEDHITQAIKKFEWGTGIWSVQDLAAATNPGNVKTTATTISAVSFANNFYNSTEYDSNWLLDFDRPLVPESMGETNYVAMFSGYLYVEQEGMHIGVFGDDGFSLTLTGAGSDSTARLVKSEVVDSPGREFLKMNGVTLSAGFYGISLDYFNRLEAGVIDLLWSTTGLDDWQTIDSSYLYATLPTSGAATSDVPEPGSLMLVVLALTSLLAVRRRRAFH